MTRVKFAPRLAALLILVGAASTSQAGLLHSYSIDNPYGSSGGGTLSNITTSYDVDKTLFNWSYTVSDNNDGFWLVVSDGPNPKSQTSEYAILYGDVGAKKIVAYEYSGLNNADSYITPGILLASWDNVITKTPISGTNNQTVSFSLDVGALNAPIAGKPEWDGLSFGHKIGIWFHPSQGTTVTYDTNDNITSFSYTGQGYHDSRNNITVTVPEPATPLLLAAGLLTLMGFKRKKTSA